ncbi:MAG: glutamine-hydrolyzing carbamoyl-phosphate synthase small subunit [Candidatus Micrarchaeaceae archaeon]
MASGKPYIYTRDGFMVGGFLFGAHKKAMGELVFTTSMTGYPESLTDPSYKGQILVFTHPLIGNYGVPKAKPIHGTKLLGNFESDRIQAEGVIVSECTSGTKWDSDSSFDSWLKAESIPGISGIDTRALTIRLRDHGTTMGVISDDRKDMKALDRYDYESINFVEMVSPKKPVYCRIRGKKPKGTIAVMDFGAKNGFINDLMSLGYDVVRAPWDSSAQDILDLKPSGIVYGNGPGNPNLLKEAIATIRELLGTGIPSMGICLGHQLTSIALGGKIRKMKFGHRAVNKGVINRIDGKAYITTHNHGYALSKRDMPKGAKILFESIDDNVVEGIIDKKHNLITTQFHPEARPGAWDTQFIFGTFYRMMQNGRKKA